MSAIKKNSWQIRPADKNDLPQLLMIYNRVIETSTAVYKDDPITLAEREAWFEDYREGGWPILVAVTSEQEDSAAKVLGYSSFGPFRSHFGGYRFSVEHTVHITEDARGSGVGSDLLNALFPIARQKDKHVMIGAIDADNQGSIRFHEKHGFEQVGHMHQVGFKFGRWLDLVWMQKII